MTGPFPRKFVTAGLGLGAVVVLVSGAMFFRVVILADDPVTGFWDILVWQAVSWLPWLGVFAIVTFPFGEKIQTFVRGWNLAAHVVATLAFAAGSTLWFKLVSENISPFLGMELTRYGVFPWFFIFWFFFGLFIYWGIVSYFGLVGATLDQSSSKPARARLVVKTGRVSEVVKPDNVMWIEAQDYYSVLHLAEKRSWIKMTMKELESTLDSNIFVRIHRSTIINVNHLKQIQKEAQGKYSAVMVDGTKRPISRVGWRDLKKILKTPT